LEPKLNRAIALTVPPPLPTLKVRKAKKGHLNKTVSLKMLLSENLVIGVAVVGDANVIKMKTGREIRSNAKGSLIFGTRGMDFFGLGGHYLRTMMFM
jgi:hypothetical protein